MEKISFVLEELDDEYTDSDEDYGWFVALDVDGVVENKFDRQTLRSYWKQNIPGRQQSIYMPKNMEQAKTMFRSFVKELFNNTNTNQKKNAEKPRTHQYIPDPGPAQRFVEIMIQNGECVFQSEEPMPVSNR